MKDYIDLGEGKFTEVTTVEREVLASEVEASLANEVAQIERQILSLQTTLAEKRKSHTDFVAKTRKGA